MNIRPKVRNAALIGALAAVAASAWATNEALSDSTYVPAPSVAAERPAATASDVMTMDDSLSTNESVVPADEASVAPVADRSVAQPGITVEKRRLSDDERIQAAVMEKLASNPRLAGKIAVESRDSEVTLSGYTSTAGMAWRAGRDAGSVRGVRYVHNEIRPRVGGSV